MRITKILLFITLSLSAFSQCALVYNPFTNQWNCGGASGTVGGASNLTTVGAIPYVSASGVLNQDPTALFWDAANNSLGIRTNSPNPAYAATIGGTVSLDSIDQRVNLPFRISTLYDTAIQFFVNSAEAARFAATTRNLLIGTTTDDTTNKLQVVGTYQAAFLAASGSNNNFTKIDSAAGARVYQTNASGTVVNLIQSSSSASYFNAGNLLIGTTTDDGSNKLQVAGNVKVTAGSNNLTVSGSSGQTPGILFNQSAVGNFYIRSQASTANLEMVNDSLVRLASLSQAGTFSVYNETATTGSTKAVVRAGAGQSTTNLMEWQDSAGTRQASVSATGALFGSALYVGTGSDGEWGPSALKLKSNQLLGWVNGSNATGTADLSLSRASAGVLQVGDGGANALGQVNARAVNSVNTLVAYNSTGGIFMAGNAGSSWGTMQSYSDGAGTAKATAINPNGGNVLVGTTTDDGSNKLQVAGTVAISSGTASAYNLTARFLAPSMLAGQTVYISLGKAAATNNQASISYEHVADGSSSNFISVYPDSGARLFSMNFAGTTTFYNEKATTGSTKLVVRAGAGQSGNLQEWQNNAGTVLASVTSSGAVASSGSIGINDTGYALTVTGSAGSYVKGLSLPAGSMVGFTGSGNWYSALDLAIARSAAGILEINNGTAGTYRDLIARTITVHNGTASKAILDSATLLVRVANDSMYGFSSTAGATGSIDLALYRSASGILEINNGTAGTYRDLLLRRSQHNGVTVASLPAAAAGNAGSIQYVTDANATTIGSTVAGGGANKVMVWSDGTNWKIFAN